VTLFHGDCLKKIVTIMLNKNEFLKFESKSNNYVFVSVVALYHQKYKFRKEIIPNVQM